MRPRVFLRNHFRAIKVGRSIADVPVVKSIWHPRLSPALGRLAVNFPHTRSQPRREHAELRRG